MNTEDFSNKTTLLKAKTTNINIKVPIATKFAWNTLMANLDQKKQKKHTTEEIFQLILNDYIKNNF